MFEPVFDTQQEAVIKVIGVGGGGGNALNHMVATQPENIGSVEFFSVNTDAQVLRSSTVRNTVQIGAGVTKGLGAGGDPNVGYQAAEEDRDALTNMIEGADMVFIAAGMGGGSGTGAAPVIAEIAKAQDALTVGIVTKPFSFEGKKRSNYAEQGIRELAKHVDSLIIIQNDKLLKVLPKNVKFNEAFAHANDVLRNAVLGITDMITSEGVVNVDFADVKKVMSEMGRAMMGTGIAEGENRAEMAAKEAVASPLLEDVDLSGAKGILVNISSGYDIELAEVTTIMDYVTSFADPDATIIFGSAYYPDMEGKIRVTLVATGLGLAEDAILPSVRGIPTGVPVGSPTMPAGKPAFPNGQGYPTDNHQYNSQPVQQQQQFQQPLHQGQFQQPVQPRPHQLDSSQMLRPTTLPGFMQNNGKK